MERTVQIQAPLPHIKSVNIWLLRGDPLTLIDTGPRTDEALMALEAGLGREGLRIEDIELVIPTHHHLDHSGLIATIVAPLRGQGGGARSHGRLRGELRRAVRGRPLVLRRAHAPPRRAGVRDRGQRGVLGFHPRHLRRLRDRRRAVGRRRHHGRRARSADPGAAGAQHNRRPARRRVQRGRLRRRPPARRDLVERRDRARGRAHRIATSGTHRVPQQPQADRVDAA